MTENNYILEMKNITKVFPGVKALDDVSIAVKKGTVHSLMGENGAGKSTLMNCLFGIYKLDGGEILLDGQRANFANPADALNNGVSMVHQELNQVLHQTVMENMWLGRYPMKGGLVDHKKMYDMTKEIFAELDIDVDPRTKMGALPVSKKQMAEIAKAVSYDAKVIAMDEPTSSLTDKEVEHLFRIIKKLKSKGTSIVYISHKMEEILKISDEVTIMRDGRWIATESAREITMDEIIKYMVGRELTERYPVREAELGEPLLKVEQATAFTKGFHDINFTLRKGEVLGLAGLVGAQRTEFLEALFGLRKLSGGKITLHGQEIKNNSPMQAIGNGFALLTEERRKDGIISGLSVSENMILSNINKYVNKVGLLNNQIAKKNVSTMIERMNIKTPSAKTPIGNLSGGNQQKVILGRWLLTSPEVLLLDEPTRGVDVGAKYEIYQLINELASQGKGIIMVSSEMPELLGVCDRIMVMSNGRQSGIFDAKQTSQVEIMSSSAKYI